MPCGNTLTGFLSPLQPCPRRKTSQTARQPGPHIACSHIRANSLAGVNMSAGEKMVELVPLCLRPGSGSKQQVRHLFYMSELPPSLSHPHHHPHTHQCTFHFPHHQVSSALFSHFISYNLLALTQLSLFFC